MPSRNTVRAFTTNQFFHVYNRGVEKRKIFLDEEDYKIFLYYLYIYLADPEKIKVKYPKLRPHLKNNNLFGKVKLIAYCLMPNHFHFLLYQLDADATTKLIKQVTIAYTRYFNTKYKRVGPLMQGKYKAASVTEESYLLHLTRYIHQNPLKVNFVLTALRNYQWSSYKNYLHLTQSDYLYPEEILTFFSTVNPQLTYESFVEASTEASLTEDLTLEAD